MRYAGEGDEVKSFRETLGLVNEFQSCEYYNPILRLVKGWMAI